MPALTATRHHLVPSMTVITVDGISDLRRVVARAKDDKIVMTPLAREVGVTKRDVRALLANA